jgi:hypothetical protein
MSIIKYGVPGIHGIIKYGVPGIKYPELKRKTDINLGFSNCHAFQALCAGSILDPLAFLETVITGISRKFYAKIIFICRTRIIIIADFRTI